MWAEKRRMGEFAPSFVFEEDFAPEVPCLWKMMATLTRPIGTAGV